MAETLWQPSNPKIDVLSPWQLIFLFDIFRASQPQTPEQIAAAKPNYFVLPGEGTPLATLRVLAMLEPDQLAFALMIASEPRLMAVDPSQFVRQLHNWLDWLQEKDVDVTPAVRRAVILNYLRSYACESRPHIFTPRHTQHRQRRRMEQCRRRVRKFLDHIDQHHRGSDVWVNNTVYLKLILEESYQKYPDMIATIVSHRLFLTP